MSVSGVGKECEQGVLVELQLEEGLHKRQWVVGCWVFCTIHVS